jgi:hypothetical protein
MSTRKLTRKEDLRGLGVDVGIVSNSILKMRCLEVGLDSCGPEEGPAGDGAVGSIREEKFLTG